MALNYSFKVFADDMEHEPSLEMHGRGDLDTIAELMHAAARGLTKTTIIVTPPRPQPRSD